MSWRGVPLALALTLLAPAARGQALPEAQQPPDTIRAFLAKHCLECHGAEKPKGRFRVDHLSGDFTDQAGRERWSAVLQRIKAGEMPPKGKPRPPETDTTPLTQWIAARAEAAEVARRAREGRVVLRRLNRVESRTPSATCWESKSICAGCWLWTARWTASTTLVRRCIFLPLLWSATWKPPTPP
jgi:hypothetical protein